MQTCPRNWDDHHRELSYHTRVVEKWNPFAKIRQDLCWTAGQTQSLDAAPRGAVTEDGLHGQGYIRPLV
jgi:hypothetical protein